MKNNLIIVMVFTMLIVFGCDQTESNKTDTTNTVMVEDALDHGGGQATVVDNESEKNILQVALGSDAHKTLVAAVQAASYENALVNAGPFTVFAPTDDAFGLLPEGTIEDLVKPENQKTLQDILEYHVYIGSLKTEVLTDGRVLGMANGGKITCASDGKTVSVNGANIVASVPCSNGMVHIIDKVLLPE
ncbi:MAG: fasciclin domain-containing protein [Bacteroidia bacterium]